MLFFVLILIGIIWGYIDRRINLKHNVIIKQHQLNKLYLIYVIGVVQLIFRIISHYYNLNGILIIDEIGILLFSLVFVYYNRHEYSLLIVGVGFILNNVVMILNNGKMPCINNLGIQLNVRHTIITNVTQLALLSDCIHLPYPLSLFAGLYSIGDIIIAVGIMLLIKTYIKIN